MTKYNHSKPSESNELSLKAKQSKEKRKKVLERIMKLRSTFAGILSKRQIQETSIFLEKQHRK